jgi:hypothetical protein
LYLILSDIFSDFLRPASLQCDCYNRQCQGAQGSTPSCLMELKRDSWGLSRQTQTPPLLVGAEELLPTHRRRARKVFVLVAPATDVRASMARDVQCKHVSNLHVILHNRHQQLGSHCIMLSVGAEKALPAGARGLHDSPCSPG